MTAKHADPLYRKNAAIIRKQARHTWSMGGDVECWRCGNPIEPGQLFDVGHIDAGGGHELANLHAEHRFKTGRCQGNRAAGGRLGAAITNRRAATTPATVKTTKGLLPW